MTFDLPAFPFSGITVCALLVVLIAAVTDLRTRRIPNWLTFSGVLLGLALKTAYGGVAGLKASVFGLVLGFLSYFALYLLHAMGAGDVKLMAAIGALLGPLNWLAVFVTTSLAAGVISLVVVISRKRLSHTLWNAWFIINEMLRLRAPYRRRDDLDIGDPRALKIPHGVAIAAGTILCLAGVHPGWAR